MPRPLSISGSEVMMDQQGQHFLQHTSFRRAMLVIYPALLVGWLAFPGPVRDWASERAAQGLLPQVLMPVFESVDVLSQQIGLSPVMQRLHDRLNAQLDERIR
jgi:hypothetical protein